jgi:hypothetical protein
MLIVVETYELCVKATEFGDKYAEPFSFNAQLDGHQVHYMNACG